MHGDIFTKIELGENLDSLLLLILYRRVDSNLHGFPHPPYEKVFAPCSYDRLDYPFRVVTIFP